MEKEKLQQKLIDFEGGQILGIKDNKGEVWLGVKKACIDIGLTIGQADRQIKNIKNDVVLSKHCNIFPFVTNGGEQKILCIQLKALPIWLSSISRKSLTEEQYNKYINLLNWCLSDEFDNYKTPTKIYSFESELRDDIYNQGYFLDIKITNKEISYDFGRTDLEGVDKYNKKCCIELKKYSSMSYTVDQLLRYKNSNNFDRVIYCSYIINDELKKWCENNSIEYYIYNRELIINKDNNDIYFGLLDDIENLKYGLENFKEKENFYPTLEDTNKYKESIIKLFYKYKNNVLEYKQSNDIKNLYKMLIVIYYIKFSYIKATENDFDTNFNIHSIDEIVDQWSDGFKDYVLGFGY